MDIFAPVVGGSTGWKRRLNDGNDSSIDLVIVKWWIRLPIHDQPFHQSELGRFDLDCVVCFADND